MNFPERIANYQALTQWLGGSAQLIDELARVYFETLRAGGTLFFAGNGGSAADAQHIAAEYVGRFQEDRKPLRAIALTTDTSVLTAVANDYGYQQVFARQIQALARPGDCVTFHTTSGWSTNLYRGALACAEIPILSVIALLGDPGTCASSPLPPVVRWPIYVPSKDRMTAQLGQMMIQHLVVERVEAMLAHAAKYEPASTHAAAASATARSAVGQS